MKNLYNISKGQLITIWIFGVIGLLVAIGVASDYDSVVGMFLAVIIPFAVIFYTVGWRENNKEEWEVIKRWPRKPKGS